MSSPSQLQCQYNTITLQPGEEFILPPGAEIISVSNLANVASTCEIPTNLETPECYVISMIGANDGDGGNRDAWDNDDNNTIVRSIIVQGTEYPINQPWLGDGGEFFASQIQTFITTHPILSNILSCTGSSEGTNGDNRGGIIEICFKAIPSIGTQTFIQVSTGLPYGTTGVNSIANFIARPRSSYNPSYNPCSCGC